MPLAPTILAYLAPTQSDVQTVRSCDYLGNDYLIPKIDVETYWTTLPVDAKEVIALYHDHGTSGGSGRVVADPSTTSSISGIYNTDPVASSVD